MPADDLTDPNPATTFAHLDSTVVLSRDMPQKVFILRLNHSTLLRVSDPLVIGQEHYDVARGVQGQFCNVTKS